MTKQAKGYPVPGLVKIVEVERAEKSKQSEPSSAEVTPPPKRGRIPPMEVSKPALTRFGKYFLP